MLPDQTLSSEVLDAPFLFPDGDVVDPRQDFELGGVALNDPSQGLQVTWWSAFISEDGDEIFVQRSGEPPISILTGTNITEVALAFDSNMRPQIAFKEDGLNRFRWFDTNAGQQVITDYPGTDTLRLGLDDKRPTQSTARDVLLVYTRDNGLYFRAQRDRYLVEYTLATGLPPGRLLRVGMNTINRFQFEYVEGADPNDLIWPIGGNQWEIPLDAGFAPGEVVGVWAEGAGFIGFAETQLQETNVGPRLLIEISAPDADNLVIGYPYSAKFKPLPLNQPDGRGPMLGRKRRLIRAILSVEDAANLLANEIPVLPASGDDQGVEYTPLTGEYEVRMLGWTTKDELEIEAVSPYHAVIRAMLREYNQ
ncbi:MAG: hypothetical protein EA406_11830 [Rhodospirillales bacterium]|nr:MAG: hypothetical protein EA406_11830 [Rhodospirillales bacterium]